MQLQPPATALRAQNPARAQIAAVFEFGGAMLLGRVSTGVIQGGIANMSTFEREPAIYAYGMVVAMAVGGVWQGLASYMELNVSATHSISERPPASSQPARRRPTPPTPTLAPPGAGLQAWQRVPLQAFSLTCCPAGCRPPPPARSRRHHRLLARVRREGRR
jgi:hypothetical protein